MSRLRKLWAVALLVGALVASIGGVAAGATDAKEKAACLIGAITWDGSDNAAVQQVAVSTSPFPGLVKSKDPALRKAIRALVDDPSSDDAAHQLGKWCKAHFPKISEIRASSWSVPRYHTPTAADFTITLTVISKSCFGSAGCNITYKPDVAYSGSTLDPAKTWTVVYDIAGGESPQTANLTVKGTQVSYRNGLTQTPDDAAVLVATVTSVY